MYRLLSFLSFTAISILTVVAQEELHVFDDWKFMAQRSDAFYQHLVAEAEVMLAQRRVVIGEINDADAARARQDHVRKKLEGLLGHFPERTPLRAKVTGKIDRPDLTVEKLYFESRPNYYVTAALFIPKARQAPAPAILYCSGHTSDGFRSDTYQHIILNYVKKGFIVLAFDPIGQGERIQYFDENGSSVFGSTHEHSYPGSQAFVAGLSPAAYFTWDGIRAIDYMVSRPEIDAQRIGVAGRSGGGTQTTYIAAMDERVAAAAPECYLTTFQMLLRTRSPQDAEQNMHGLIAQGIDLADFVEVRAPRPTLMVTTTQDIFSIEGARSLYQEANRFYSLLGAADHLEKVEDDAGHASTKKNREASYAFFQKHLKNPGYSQDEAVDTFSVEELWVTEKGQLYKSLGGESLHSLIVKETKRILDQKPKMDAESIGAAIVSHNRYEEPSTPREAIFSGGITMEDRRIEKYLVGGAGDYYIPLLWLKSRTPNGKTLLLLDQQGKAHACQHQSLGHRLVKQGYDIVAPDLSGYGEMGDGHVGGDARIHNTPLNLWYAGLLVNKSLVGVRMEELWGVVHFMGQEKLHATIAIGDLGADALQFLTVENTRTNLALIQPLVSQYDIIAKRNYHTKHVLSASAGALSVYDFPDLVDLHARRGNVLIINAMDAANQVLQQSEVESQFSTVKNMGDSSLQVIVTKPSDHYFKEIDQWLNKLN